MSEQSMYLDALQQLRTELLAAHTRQTERYDALRQEMAVGFVRLGDKLETHAKEDAEVEKRLARMETQHEEEAKQTAKQTLKRGTWAGVIAAATLTALWEYAKTLLFRRPP